MYKVIIPIILLTGCTFGLIPPQVIEKHRKEYPAACVVQYPIEEVSRKFDLYIQTYKWFKPEMIFKNNPREKLMVAERADKNLFARDHLIFENPNNKYDVFIHNFHNFPICDSSVYKLKNKNARYLAEFQIHLQSIGPKETKISVLSFYNKIPGGYKWEWGHAGFLPYPQLQDVQPTGVEENELLNFTVENIISK